MKTRFTILAALTLALIPAVAYAHPTQNMVRVRTTTLHDHSPKAPVHSSIAHH
jgi:hypothetical protein